MRVTDVQTQKHSSTRVSVFLDGEYAFSLDETDAVTLGIKKGRELSEKELSECVLSSQFARAREKAIDMLSRKNVTRKEVRDMLCEKAYDEAVADAVCDELEELGYIDDYAYAVLFLEYAAEKMWGKKKICYELARRGVDNNTAEDALSGWTCADAETLARYITEKYRGVNLRDFKEKQRVVRYFASHGFDFSEINEAINICIENTEDDFPDE